MADGNTTNNNRLSGSDAAGAGGDLAASNVADNDDVVRRLAESERARRILYEQAASANRTLNKLAENSRVRNELRGKIDTIVDRQESSDIASGVDGVGGAKKDSRNVSTTKTTVPNNDMPVAAKRKVALPERRRERKKRIWIIIGAAVAVAAIAIATVVVAVNMNRVGVENEQIERSDSENTNLASECNMGYASASVCGNYEKRLINIANNSENEDERTSAAMELTSMYYYNGEIDEAIQFMSEFYINNVGLSNLNTYYVLSSLLNFYEYINDLSMEIAILERILELPEDMDLPSEDWKNDVRPALMEELALLNGGTE
ncbi:hypothetical protein IKG68_02695 [Candidatus Saccharibacteria bacterium]|nr:hypothetical protein [Candidatus Saccharibacteria bacterium]